MTDECISFHVRHRKNECNLISLPVLQDSVSQIKMSSFDFTYTLGKMLVLSHIERRYASPNGPQSQLVNKMQRVLKVAESRRIEKALDNAKEGRCHVCKGNIVGRPEYIALRDKLNHRLKKRCVKCLHFVCKGHSEVSKLRCLRLALRNYQ